MSILAFFLLYVHSFASAPPTFFDLMSCQRKSKIVILLYFNAGMRWRDPNLPEVIGFLSNTNNVIKANAAAYLQHLCYMDDPNKQKTRALGGIPPLVKLLSNESPDVYRNACGALR